MPAGAAARRVCWICARSASYLRAETLLPLGGLLPQKELRDRLREIAPSGEWTDTSVAMIRDAVDRSLALQVQAKFRDAGFAPVGRAPGLRGMTGTIAGNESGGQVASTRAPPCSLAAAISAAGARWTR